MKKLKEKINQITTKLKNYNEIYTDYILCITFLSLIIFKINKISLQIPIIYIYPVIILITILFRNQLFFITNKIKNTYLFNWFLYHFLIFKNNVYGIIFEYFDYVEHEKYQRLLVFLASFLVAHWTLNIFFFILNNSYDLSILLFLILLLLNIFNLIEKKIIFTSQNINQNQNDINYDSVKIILKITNKDFNKNKSMFYIQRRYVHLNAIKDLVKKHGPTVVSGIVVGTFMPTYIQYKRQKLQFEIQQLQQQQFEYQKQRDIELFEYQKQQFEYQKQRDIELFEYQKQKDIEQAKIQKQKDIEQLEFKKLQEKYKLINDTDLEIKKYQTDMDTSNFWNKVDHSSKIDSLKEKKSEIKKDFKIITKNNNESIPQKKIESNNDSFFED